MPRESPLVIVICFVSADKSSRLYATVKVLIGGEGLGCAGDHVRLTVVPSMTGERSKGASGGTREDIIVIHRNVCVCVCVCTTYTEQASDSQLYNYPIHS